VSGEPICRSCAVTKIPTRLEVPRTATAPVARR